MMYEIPVLALNDRSNPVSYHTRSVNYRTAQDFMKYCLCPAHLVDYKIRYVDIDDCKGDMEDIFDMVVGIKTATSAEKADAFNILWAIGTEDFDNV